VLSRNDFVVLHVDNKYIDGKYDEDDDDDTNNLHCVFKLCVVFIAV